MRRAILFILCILLLATTVSASGTVNNLDSNVSLYSDGTCRISMTFEITVEHLDGDLRFPLPYEAKDITLNGSSVRATYSNSLRWAELSGVVQGPGRYTLTLQYSLPDLVVAEKKALKLKLPLLSGFDYPIDRMNFTINLPGEIQEKPHFYSTYHPESMDSYVSYTIDGNVIKGFCVEGLKDHESFTMHLEVTEKVFPQPITKRWSLSEDDLIRYGLTLLAVLYWIFFLRCKLPHRLRRVEAPEGITAGELGCCLTGQGVDFSMMVLSWAQMGYLTIHIGRNHRIRIHKRMDMGNERSEFEMRLFKTLFGGRSVVDGSGEHYGRLGRKARKTVLGASQNFNKKSGNPMIFRIISLGIGIISGISLAKAFAPDTSWQVVLSILLGTLGMLVSWLMQAGARSLFLRHRYDGILAFIAGGLWLLLGNLAGEGNVAVYTIVTQLLTGIFSAHGGRRTEAGISIRNEVLGLRRYLKRISPEDLRRVTVNNPDYFFTMLPYALALGVDRAYSRRFGQTKLPACPYITVDGNETMTAKQWNDTIKQMVRILDDRQYKVLLQNLLGR